MDHVDKLQIIVVRFGAWNFLIWYYDKQQIMLGLGDTSSFQDMATHVYARYRTLSYKLY